MPTSDCLFLRAGLLNRHPAVTSRNVLMYTGARDCPARGVSLRAIDPERYTIVNEAAGGEVLEEIEESKAFFEVYDGAVYLYQVQAIFRVNTVSTTACTACSAPLLLHCRSCFEPRDLRSVCIISWF